ncbi:MAG: hypothetical protein PHO98_00765, partial [Synergistaceae bacterium]|nr:hypothetical protein [Synergistaceae bacterium]
RFRKTKLRTKKTPPRKRKRNKPCGEGWPERFSIRRKSPVKREGTSYLTFFHYVVILPRNGGG